MTNQVDANLLIELAQKEESLLDTLARLKIEVKTKDPTIALLVGAYTRIVKLKTELSRRP